MMMSDRPRVCNVLAGQPVDRFPVAVPYIMLLQEDQWCRLTGQPAWTFYEWMLQDPADHVKVYEDLDRQLPFDILQPVFGQSAEWREAREVVEQDGEWYYRNRITGGTELLDLDLHHRHGGPNQEQRVFDKSDVDRFVSVVPAEQRLKVGSYDFAIAAKHRLGDRKYLLNGVVGTFYQCTGYVGETNLLRMLYDEPDLVHYLSRKILEDTIERIRALAASGHDAIYIDDALTTCDMISVDFYENFSVPYVRAMVDEIHALGKPAVLIYFGGVADRIEQIASIGADALNVEASMKSYTNDLSVISDEVGDRMCLWGNIDPVGVVQKGTGEELRQAIEEQVAIGRRTGRFIVSTGSPITPETPLTRIRQFIDLGQELSAS
jgi:uroporphyrinogen-III decarboxylase